MDVDVLFIDTVAPYSYEAGDLEGRPLGGTEQAVIRMAEGLAGLGMTVAVLQPQLQLEFMGQAFYLPWSWADKLNPKVVIHLRSIANLKLFKNAKHYVWLHDLSQPFMKDWVEPLREVNATAITVSEWHKQNILEAMPYDRVITLYSPVDDGCYQQHAVKYNPNSLVWLSSPHKGLPEALEVFKRVKKVSPSTILSVLNPGYLPIKSIEQPGVRYLGSISRAELRGLVASSLALFYPTKFQETFGMVAAESEALGTPVATYKVAGLNESVGASGFCKDEDELVSAILKWQEERPVVKGQERFRLVNVLKKWVAELLS